MVLSPEPQPTSSALGRGGEEEGEMLSSPSKRSLVALLEKVKHLHDNLTGMTRPGRLVLGSLAGCRPDGGGRHGGGL